jgi:hypothetical protein
MANKKKIAAALATAAIAGAVGFAFTPAASKQPEPKNQRAEAVRQIYEGSQK